MMPCTMGQKIRVYVGQHQTGGIHAVRATTVK